MIRQPLPDEYGKVNPLLYQSGPEMFNWFFVSESCDEVCRFFDLLYAKPDTAFSKELIWIEEEEGTVRGTILGIPGREKKLLEKSIGKYGKEIGRIAGLRRTIIMIFRGRLGRYLSVIDTDEYYIGNLAVHEDHRGKGIGPALLDRIRDVAVSAGYRKLSLLVELGNDHAEHVYTRFGFETVRTIDFPKKYHRYGLRGFKKMVKPLTK